MFGEKCYINNSLLDIIQTQYKTRKYIRSSFSLNVCVIIELPRKTLSYSFSKWLIVIISTILTVTLFKKNILSYPQKGYCMLFGSTTMAIGKVYSNTKSLERWQYIKICSCVSPLGYVNWVPNEFFRIIINW